MTSTYRQGDEPVMGYELREYLGRGGFGEVWQATGPGGVQVAMKIIRDLDRKKGGKELRALQRLKDIRHPHLVPLTGLWLKGRDGTLISAEAAQDSLSPEQPTPAGNRKGRATEAESVRGTLEVDRAATPSVETVFEVAELLVAMGLCERSLFDRLRECQEAGLNGVPLAELLTYMEDSARAIDLLNTKYQIQHCDIKPQNILLLNGAAQVCDFGLAKAIGDVRESSMGAGTIAYGAPEVLIGKGPSATTDQYSLAISYFELRTGQLPFASERISDVLRAKQHGGIDLSLLPEAESDVISRAASIDPNQRFASCREMLNALRIATFNAPAVKSYHHRSQTSRLAFPWKRKAVWGAIGSAAIFIAAIVSFGVKSTSRDQAETKLPIASTSDPHHQRPSLPLPPRSQDTPPPATPIAAAPAQPNSTVPPAIVQSKVSDLEPIANAEADHESDKSGITPSPNESKSHLELYREARLHEELGEHAIARQVYRELLSRRLNVVDPHVRYQRLLIRHEGVAGAQKTYAEMASGESDVATKFAALLLEPNETRAGRLLDFSIQNPEFVPVIYELSREFSAQRLGTQTLAEIEYERNLLEQLTWWIEQGKLSQFYLAPDAAAELVEESRARLAAIQKLEPEMFAKRVRVSISMTPASWFVTLIVSEAAHDIQYQFEGSDEFQSTGLLDYIDPRSGRQMPKSYFELPQNSPRIKFSAKYTDVRGHEQGPYEFDFDPAVERLRCGKQSLSEHKTLWVSFFDSDGTTFANFTTPVMYRFALREVQYSFDSEKLDQKFSLPPEHPGRTPGTILADDRVSITVPPGSKYLAVKLTYWDGESSVVQNFHIVPPEHNQL
jgi:serine/threonine protein kinase